MKVTQHKDNKAAVVLEAIYDHITIQLPSGDTITISQSHHPNGIQLRGLSDRGSGALAVHPDVSNVIHVTVRG